MKSYYTYLAIAGLLLVFGLVGRADYQEAIAQEERYCDMIAIYDETNGESGWPAYDGDCK